MTRILKGCTWVEVPSPVPPVVPDSAGKTWEEVTSVYGIGSPESMEAFRKSREASGSGVVPDKPALAPEPWLWTCPVCGFGAVNEGEHRYSVDGQPVVCPGAPRPNASVPAVTDDEAATEVIALEFHRSFCGAGTGCRVVDPQGTRCAGLDSEDFRAANDMLSGLRSAGFLIVHHTKET